MKLNLLYVSSQKNKNALFLEDDLVKRIKSPLKLELKKIFCKTESNNIEQQKNFESEQIKKFLNKNNFLFCCQAQPQPHPQFGCAGVRIKIYNHNPTSHLSEKVQASKKSTSL